MSNDRSDLANQLIALALREVGTHALMLLDPNGVVVGWYAGGERLLGYKSNEIMGQNISVLFTPEDLEKNLSLWEQTTANVSGESENDRWQVRKDGGRIWVSGTLTAIHNEQGQLLGFAKIVRNQTDQKWQTETLESRVALLEQAEQRKNIFISTLAHELRNPLSTILSAAYLLEPCKKIDDDLALAIEMIQRQVEFMGRMVEDLLTMARVGAGKATLRKQPVVLQKIIQQAVESCQASIEEHSHNLQQLLPEVSIDLDADPTRLQQIFINLIENAAKYTPDGGTIWIKATTEGNEAVVRVQDTGIGISPQQMPTIFDLFTQADSECHSESGLGIGLSVVKEIVTLHGGTVQATSDGLGKGSEFTVRLPLSDVRQ